MDRHTDHRGGPARSADDTVNGWEETADVIEETLDMDAKERAAFVTRLTEEVDSLPTETETKKLLVMVADEHEGDYVTVESAKSEIPVPLMNRGGVDPAEKEPTMPWDDGKSGEDDEERGEEADGSETTIEVERTVEADAGDAGFEAAAGARMSGDRDRETRETDAEDAETEPIDTLEDELESPRTNALDVFNTALRTRLDEESEFPAVAQSARREAHQRQVEEHGFEQKNHDGAVELLDAIDRRIRAGTDLSENPAPEENERLVEQQEAELYGDREAIARTVAENVTGRTWIGDIDGESVAIG